MTDPRHTQTVSGRDIRPVVERPRAGLSGTAIGVIAGVAALVLFGTLEARRRDASAPAIMRPTADRSSAAPPPLYVPPPLPPYQATQVPPDEVRPLPARPFPSRSAVLPTVAQPAPPPLYMAPPYTPPPPVAPRNIGGAALVVDAEPGASSPSASDRAQEDATGPIQGRATGRARAAMLANRATTVPQGTLIPAVLETAFDSTSPGFARALVQRDVRGFDGTRVLIPRGSRLIGEYGAAVTQGQNRAVILWSRLIRPDGVTIAIGSPAADTLGRGGVKADVDSHFFARFGGAILQSVLDAGVAVAARNSGSPVIVALPGGAGNTAAAARPRASDIPPTLKVPPGRSVGVFVARDLDFTGADAFQ